MWALVLSLLVLGAILLLAEVFVPGLIVGTAGFIALVAAAVLAYRCEGATAGNLVVLAEVIGGGLFVFWWLRYVPKSAFAKRWTLHTSVPETTAEPHVSLLGQVGEAASSLRPAGIAIIAGQRVPVVSEGELIAAGEPLRVTKVEGNHIVVRRESCHSEVSA